MSVSPPPSSPRPGVYRGRFAPSPTGLLHAGSMVAALASWLDARAAGGVWLVRMEDVDAPRTVPGASEGILRQLADCGLVSDAPVMVQSTRTEAYARALERLADRGLAYPCACSRRDIELALGPGARERHGELVYPGTCRAGLGGRPARAWRFRLPEAAELRWEDRRLGPQRQNVAREVGDFVLRRADGLFAYQLAVVVDDEAQGITHVVRGEDLASNTARQILLARALGATPPCYLHTPLVCAADGQKLSKQNGARPVATGSAAEALRTLDAAARHLGLAPSPPDATIARSLALWCEEWRCRWPDRASAVGASGPA